MTNEAAERVRIYLSNYVPLTKENPRELLDEALAAERRATVERIRERLLAELPAPMADGDEILWSTVIAILDEAAK